MNTDSPYQSPSAGGPLPPQQWPGQAQYKPGVITVFGILHIVFASLGILVAIWGFLQPLIMSHLADSSSPQMQMQIAMQEKIRPAALLTTSLSLIVGLIMLPAGIKLLKNKRDALKWSRTYSFASIVKSMVTILVTLFVILPAMKGAFDSVPGMDPKMRSVMATTMNASAVAGSVLYMIYPILSLVLLSRPQVKAWFANSGI
jgi:hypothetical protein